ncbi:MULTISPECIES: type II toxin-antitoxin system HicA family toxin [Allobacillus]|uniref:Type II toxin-antitoxin system HicA family toxin n=1 Tax=Allobacillus halotolerans TaxID=570278 RepID=A0ABS6GSQ5_9BACI|nr:MULTISPECIES: type II toxin-antitoxin system HicA family toxin [Allobacillus]MBU6081650.1 type II toxin-antitoxin system HicA family toxin [Allobacillus halotolerans]TSJ66355.1 type II toxin-antitoxin system HicA family toxin [Allobacillus sp. SKP2-8]
MPSWREIERFCRRDGWEEFKKKGHHIYFRKKNNDGTVKRTKVSRGTGEVKGHLWKEILKKQLQVTEEEFNAKK